MFLGRAPSHITTKNLLLLAFPDRADPCLDELARTRPRRVGVWIIGRPHQFIRAVFLAGEADVLGLELEGGPNLALHVLARLERQTGAFKVAQAVIGMVDPVAEVG